MSDPQVRPDMDVRREIRFAVVLYGGVSLAVYINGVVQELLAMVRATAPDPAKPTVACFADYELTPTERVYRRLAKVLHGERQGPVEAGALPPEEFPGTIHTRFIVDVISGTSAGGINGIYLAKALARGQRLRRLADLWIELADIDTLLYDKRSALPTVPFEDPPPSLLNGRRMLKLLHDAFEGMEDAAAPGSLVNSVDCFVTTTDIQGLPIYLQLADESVPESWHRKVIQLRYARDGQALPIADDFTRDSNPMLAFAARCTSAFPLAFEPVQLADIETVLGAGPVDKWLRFFPEYVVPDAANPLARTAALAALYRPHNHAFGDGGYLDNKPFSYAIDALSAIRGSKPMDRKLIYVEPSPEHPEDTIAPAGADGGPAPRPTAVANTLAALTLARQETIRDELQRVTDRNALIDRVDRILGGTDGDLGVLIADKCRRNPPATSVERTKTMQATGFEWANEGLAERMETLGPAYGGYHRLKVSGVTDDLATVLATLAGFSPASDEVRGMRYLARAWRRCRFAEQKPAEAPPVDGQIPPATPQPPAPDHRQTENAFLFRYDLGYRLRRLDLVLARLDALSAMDDRTDRLLSGIRANIDQVLPAAGRPKDSLFARDLTTWTSGERSAVQRAVARLAADLSDAYDHLMRAQTTLISRASDAAITAYVMRQPLPENEDTSRLLSPGAPPTAGVSVNALATAVRTSPFSDTLFAELLAKPTDEARDAFARDVVAKHWEALDRIGVELARRVTPIMHQASQLADVIFTASDATNARWNEVREVVRFIYDSYECFDLVSYPIRFATKLEANIGRVDVVRISPEDAKSIVDERLTRRPPAPLKLAGTSMRNFGGFFDRGWRQNDLNWGRLDGAERLLKTVLAGRDATHVGTWEAWAAVAQESIFEEHVRGSAVATLSATLATAIGTYGALPSPAPGAPPPPNFWERWKGAVALVRPRVGDPSSAQAVALQTLLQTPQQLRAVYAAGTNISRTVNRATALSGIGRASRIVGRMLRKFGADAQRPEVDRGARLLGQLGGALWGLVEIATPEHLWSTLVRRWLQVAVIAELLVLTGALVVPRFHDLRPLAIVLLAATILLQVAVLAMRVWLARGPRHWRAVLQVGAALVVVLLIGAAILEIPHLPVDVRAIGTWLWTSR